MPTGNFLFRKNDGVTADHVYTMSSKSLLNVRGGWQRFGEPNVRQHEGLFDPATLGFSPAVARPVRRRAVLPALRFRHAQRHRRQPRREHHALDLLVPADLHADDGEALGEDGLRHAALSRVRRERRAVRRVTISFATTPRSPGSRTTRPSQNWQDVASFLVGPADRRVDRGQRDPVEQHVVSRRVRSGRLEALEQAHGQPRAALRVRRRDDRFREPERSRIRSLGIAQHHERRGGSLRRQPHPAGAGVCLPRSWRAAVCDRRPARILERRRQQHPAARGLRVSAGPADGPARRDRRLHRAVHHCRQLPAGVLADARRSCRRWTEG